MTSPFVAGEIEVHFAHGGIWLWNTAPSGPHGVAIDAPAGMAAAIGADLARLSAIVVTSGRARAIGGLIELLEATAAHRDPALPLVLHVPFGEERGAALADLWVQHWQGRFPLTVDAERAGVRFDAGGMQITTVALRAAEPDWAARDVVPRVAIGVIAEHAGARVAILLGAAPDPGLERHCAGADLAVIEVGVLPWPRSDVAWRLRPDQAIAVGAGARALWIVGDDGRRIEAPAS